MMSENPREEFCRALWHHWLALSPERSSTKTKEMLTPDAAALRAASSTDSRSELSSHSEGSVTEPLTVTGDAANVGRPSASSIAVRTATRLKRRNRDTGSSCEVANR
jgi:hypothetical protein